MKEGEKKDKKTKIPPLIKTYKNHLKTIQGANSLGHGLRLHGLQLRGVAAGLRHSFGPQGAVHGTAPGTVPRDGRQLHMEGQRMHLRQVVVLPRDTI